MWRKPTESYKGMEIGAAPGTHAAAVEQVLLHVEARSGVLDCGCRTGALLSRLRDAGFTDLQGIDLDTQKFAPSDIPLALADLNGDFDTVFERKFNLITASEVVEHLNSPRDFARKARNLLEDDGYLLITVPNIAFWVGRVKFALMGEHWGYGEKFYRSARHISPTTHEEMSCILRETGFEVVSITTAGSFFAPVKRVVTAPLAALFRLVGGAATQGECSIFLARKAAPDVSLAQPGLYFADWQASRQVAATKDAAA